MVYGFGLHQKENFDQIVCKQHNKAQLSNI
jgi:hypothetical protein